MYSPISTIYIKNFRNIGEIELSFKESPIICLLGENEAGKTSAIKAFGVCALHATPRDQKDFIRNGTQMFGVIIQLEDGHKIVRMKTTGINKYQVIKPDGTAWETTKISEGLPVEVQKLMGLIEEPETKEFLHIRTYEDKLLFVVTQASANYKVMYNALKVEQLTKAIKLGSNEVNAVRNRLNVELNSIQTLNTSLQSIHEVDIEPVLEVKDRLNKQLASLDKLERAVMLKNKINECNKQLGVLRLIDTFKLKEIEMDKAMRLSAVGNMLNKLAILKENKNRLSDVNNLEIIDMNLLNSINSIMIKRDELSDKKVKSASYIELSKLDLIDEVVINQLTRAQAIRDNINHSKNLVSIYDTKDCPEVNEESIKILDTIKKVNFIKERNKQCVDSNTQYIAYINQVTEWMKSLGVAFEVCQKCGNDVLIDLDKLGELQNG